SLSPIMFLSASAQPFQPLEFAIFNNGVPSSVFYGIHPEHDVVQHIPDDAIEEIFPPSAEDIAELEAAEDHVEVMAWLSYLDECDEAARTSFAGYQKRWAARRQDGLIGKPHPPRKDRRSRHHLEDDGSSLSSAGEQLSIVPYVPRMFEVRPRKMERMYGNNAAVSVPKNARGVHMHRKSVQRQPRNGHYQ
ncbi:hypothetical protein ACHAXR_011917, partial [Thalassiosira sp. AJA248-18]